MTGKQKMLTPREQRREQIRLLRLEIKDLGEAALKEMRLTQSPVAAAIGEFGDDEEVCVIVCVHPLITEDLLESLGALLRNSEDQPDEE